MAGTAKRPMGKNSLCGQGKGGDAPITSQPGASAPFVAPDGEERLAQFVATGDLSLLPIEAEKAVDAFNAYQCYCACFWNLALTVAGVPCVVAIFCPGKFCPSVRGDITRKSYLSLSAEEVVLSQPDVDFCCHIAEQKRTIPLDIITDVEVKESCIDRCAGTKCLQMHVIGYKSKGTAPQFLRNPEAWREPREEGGKRQVVEGERVGAGGPHRVHRRAREERRAAGARRDQGRAPVLRA